MHSSELEWIKSNKNKFPKGKWFVEFFSYGEFHAHQIKKLIAFSITKFQNVFLVDTISFGKVLIIDGETQSTEYDEFIYHEALVIPSLLLYKYPQNVLILGGGEGATAREILNCKTIKKVIMVDIDHKVLEFARKHLYSWHKGSFDNEKLLLLVQDAEKYVNNTSLKFDIIYSDLPSPIEGGPAYRLYTIEFYKKLKTLLNKNGIFAMQAGPATTFGFELHQALYNTVSKVFKNIFSYCFFIPGYDMPWSFLIASDLKFDFDSVDDNTIVKRFKSKPKLIDTLTIKNLYNIPLYLNRTLKKDKTKIITLNRPMFFTTSRSDYNE